MAKKIPGIKLSGGKRADLVMGEGDTWKQAYIRLENEDGKYTDAIDNDMKLEHLKTLRGWISKIIEAQKPKRKAKP